MMEYAGTVGFVFVSLLLLYGFPQLILMYSVLIVLGIALSGDSAIFDEEQDLHSWQ